MANLLTKLLEAKAETAKQVGAFVLAGTMLITGMTGCASNTQQPTTATTPNIGGITTPQENEKHSNLLMSVMYDEYYKSIMTGTPIQKYNSPALDPHPYAFLENQGIDVNKILDGTYKATTTTFVYDDEPNNLYMNTRILIDNSYYQSYLLTYKLSDKEMADYRLVHGSSENYSYSWPAFFINDKISETKQPTRVLSTKYTKETHNVFNRRAELYTNGATDYILPSISSDSYIYLQYDRHFNADAAVESKSIIAATFKYNHVKNFDGVYEIVDTFDYATMMEKTTKKATTFNLQDATIFRSHDFVFSND